MIILKKSHTHENLVEKLKAKDGVDNIINIFDIPNVEIRFVGGCIRNIILGIKNYDIDFAINCEPQETINILKKNKVKYSDYGIKYGSIVAVINKNKFEITTLREDFNQRGRDTDIRFNSNWKKDASRRDFTINAMYLSTSGVLYDYFKGLEDLENQTIRFIGNIEERIQEDYIRILRFYRFLGCFEEINLISNYESILRKYIPMINSYITFDIMRSEILKMLKNPFVKNSLRDFHNPISKNFLIENINKWWLEENYELGIKKCINKIDKFF